MSADPIRALAQALNAEKRVADQLAEAIAGYWVADGLAVMAAHSAMRRALDAYYAHRGGPS